MSISQFTPWFTYTSCKILFLTPVSVNAFSEALYFLKKLIFFVDAYRKRIKYSCIYRRFHCKTLIEIFVDVSMKYFFQLIENLVFFQLIRKIKVSTWHSIGKSSLQNILIFQLIEKLSCIIMFKGFRRYIYGKDQILMKKYF